jgi:hypothetical protein
VDRVRDELPADSRGRAVILTANYGEAGALLVLGGVDPTLVYSGHNAFGDWGPPPDGAAPVVVVGYGDEYLAGLMTGCRQAGTIDNGYGVENEEQGAPIHVCEGPVGAWSEVWPRIRHLD